MSAICMKNTFLSVEESTDSMCLLKAQSLSRSRSAGAICGCTQRCPGDEAPQLERLNKLLGLSNMMTMHAAPSPASVQHQSLVQGPTETQGSVANLKRTIAGHKRIASNASESTVASVEANLPRTMSGVSMSSLVRSISAVSMTSLVSTSDDFSSQNSDEEVMTPVTRPKSSFSEESSPSASYEESVSSEQYPKGTWNNRQLHKYVPKFVDFAEETAVETPVTTLMIRNIPNRYSQKDLIAELSDNGFGHSFDFLYLPLDKGTMSNVGYAFVNFVNPKVAEEFMQVFQGYCFTKQPNRKTKVKDAIISVAHLQGLKANLAHYERSAVNAAKSRKGRPVLMAVMENLV